MILKGEESNRKCCHCEYISIKETNFKLTPYQLMRELGTLRGSCTVEEETQSGPRGRELPELNIFKIQVQI